MCDCAKPNQMLKYRFFSRFPRRDKKLPWKGCESRVFFLYQSILFCCRGKYLNCGNALFILEPKLIKVFCLLRIQQILKFNVSTQFLELNPGPVCRHSSPEGNVGLKKGARHFFCYDFLGLTDHENSFPQIRSAPSWA